MKKATLAVFFLALVLALAGPASAVVVDFDSLAAAQMPTGYAGFTWDSQWWVYDLPLYNSYYGNTNTVTFPSNPNAAFNGNGVPMVSISRSSFDLVGAYFSTWLLNNEVYWDSAAALTVTGYREGNPVGSLTFSLTPEFVYHPLGFNNIDLVTFEIPPPTFQDWWLMDNLTYNLVPIPGAVWLLGSGLLGLAGLRRNFKRN